MSVSNLMLIAMTEAKDAVAAADGIEAKFMAAASVTRNHWICTDSDEQFRAAVGAVMMDYGQGTAEFARIAAEMDAMRSLSAFLKASDAGLSVAMPEQAEFEAIGLMRMWQQMGREAKA